MWHRGGIDCNIIKVDATDSLHQETSQSKTDNQWSLHVFYELLIQIHGLAKENYKINRLIWILKLNTQWFTISGY